MSINLTCAGFPQLYGSGRRLYDQGACTPIGKIVTLRRALESHNAKFGNRPTGRRPLSPDEKNKRVEDIAKRAVVDRIDGIFALERRLRDVIDHRLGRLGLTYSQYAVLRFIDDPRDHDGKPQNRPVGPTDVETYFSLQKRTVARTLRQLEDKGMLTQRPSVEDRRRVELAISPSKSNAFKAASDEVRHVGNELGMTGSREQEFASWFLVPRMLRNLDRFDP